MYVISKRIVILSINTLCSDLGHPSGLIELQQSISRTKIISNAKGRPNPIY